MEDKILKLFLNAFGVVSVILFGSLFILTAMDAPIMQDGGSLRLLRWDVLSPHVELMIEAVYFIWGIYMFLAARNPRGYISFLSFTAWANLVHGVVMLPMAFMISGFTYKLFTDVAYCLILAIGIFILMPKGQEQSMARS